MILLDLFFIAVLTSILKGADANCLNDIHCMFCQENTFNCLWCKESYAPNQQGICVPTNFCLLPYSKILEQCVEICPDDQISFISESGESICEQKIECPLYLQPLDTSLDLIFLTDENGYAQYGILSLEQNSQEIEILDPYSGQSVKKISETNAIRDYIIFRKQNISVLVAWTTQNKIIILKNSLSFQFELLEINLDSDPHFQVLEVFLIWSNIEIQQILVALFDSLMRLIITNVNIKIPQQSQICGSVDISSAIDKLIFLKFFDEQTIIYSGKRGNQSFVFLFDISQDTIKELCIFPEDIIISLIFLPKQLILYYSSTSLYTSSLTSCFNKFASIQFNNIEQVTVDKLNNYVLVITNNQLHLLSFVSIPNSESLTFLSQIDKPSISIACSCINQFICYDQSNNIYEIVISADKSMKMQVLTNHYSNIKSIITLNEIILVKTTEATIFIQDKLSLSSDTCFFTLKNNNYFEEKINLISASKKKMESSEGAIVQLKLISPQSDNQLFTNLNLIKKALQLEITPYEESDVFDFPSWLEQITSFQVIKVSGFKSCQLKESLTLNSSFQDSIFYLENVSFSQESIQSSTINIENMNKVVINSLTLQSIKSINFPLISIQNCKEIIINQINVQSVNFTTSESNLIYISHSNSVKIVSINISNCSLLSTKFIEINQVHQIEIQNIIMNSNIQPLNINYLSTLLSINESRKIIIFKANFQSNKNLNLIDVSQKFTFLKKLVAYSENYVLISNITADSNYNTKSNQLLSIEADKFFATNLSFVNNNFSNAYGQIFIMFADTYIQNSVFSSNIALTGGALYFNFTNSVNIYDCQFKNNIAIASGGAILVNGSSIIINKTKIINNSAMIGGAIKLDNAYRYQIHWDDDCYIQGNSAILYGMNVVTRLTRREILVNGKNMTEVFGSQFDAYKYAFLQLDSLYVIDQAFEIDNIRSGEYLQLVIRLYDIDNMRFVYDPSKFDQFPEIIKQEIHQLKSGMITVGLTLVGDYEMANYSFEQQGFASENLLVYGSPNKTLSIILLEQYIEKISNGYQSRILQEEINEKLSLKSKVEDVYSNLKQNLEFLQKERQLSILDDAAQVLKSKYKCFTGLMIRFRECYKGEIVDSISDQANIIQCLPCPLNSYTFSNTSTKCNKCPDSASVCQNETLILRDGYWRENLYSDEIFQCDPIQNFCLETTFSSTHQQCKEGYVGPLCSACDLKGKVWGRKYSQNRNKECQVCGTLIDQILNLVLIFVLTLIYLFFQTTLIITSSTLNSLGKYVRKLGFLPIYVSGKKNSSGSMIKILTHYLQITSVIKLINIKLPSIIDYFDMIQGNPNTSFVLSSSCIINQLEFYDSLRLRIMQSAILPTFYSLCFILGYFLINLFKKINKQFIHTLIIFIIMFFQPDCVKFLLSSIGCKKLGSNIYLIADSNYECYSTENYYSFLLQFTIPALAFWVLGPQIILIYLWKNKKSLDHISTKNIFGYLYLDYKQDFFYFEFLRSFFKMVIISIFILSSSLSSPIKYDLIAAIIFLYIIISHNYKPFLKASIGKLDELSHVWLIVIVILEMFISNQRFGSSMNYVMSLIVVILNTLYICSMVTLIAFNKLMENNFLNRVLKIIKFRFGKCLPFLLKINIYSPSERTSLLMKWKLIKKKIPLIIKLKQKQKIIDKPYSNLYSQKWKPNLVNSQFSVSKSKTDVNSEENVLKLDSKFNILFPLQKKYLDSSSSKFLLSPNNNLTIMRLDSYNHPVSENYIFKKEKLFSAPNNEECSIKLSSFEIQKNQKKKQTKKV